MGLSTGAHRPRRGGASGPIAAAGPAPRRRFWLTEEQAKSGIAFTMALLTCLAAGVASLSADANARKANAQRSSDQINEQLAGLRGEVQSQLARDLDAWGLEFRQLEQSLAEGDQAAAAPDETRRILAQRLAQIDQEIAQWLVSRGGLFSAPYYNPTTFSVDFPLYQATISERGIQLEQQAKRDGDVAQGWDGIGNGTITVLTLIAVALFFLGLSASIGGRSRPILGIAGVVTGLVAGSWTVSLASMDVHRVSDGAIAGYVRAQVESIAAGPTMGILSDGARAHLDAAVDAARQAVAIDPEYLDGRLELANTSGNRALALIFEPGGTIDAGRSDLLEARSAYREVISRDPVNPTAWWNIGWVHYLLGDNNSALDAAGRALALRPDNPAILMNKAAALIALGREDDAGAAMTAAISVAAARAGGATDYTLREADSDMTRLLRVRPEAERRLLAMSQELIRSASVARRIGRDPFTLTAPPAVAAEVRPVTLDTASGQFQTGDPLAPGSTLTIGTTTGLSIALTPSGTIPATAKISLRVWRDSEEDPDYRIDRAWSDGATILMVSPYGRANIPMAAGAYHVEIYVDAVRVVSFDATLT